MIQVDDYYSYDALPHISNLLSAFPENLNLRIHYKIYKNIPLDSNGKVDSKNPDSGNGEVHIDNDYYFVLKNGSFEKSNDLFLESVFQMCLFNVSPKNYFRYMEKVKAKCFGGLEANGTPKAVYRFADCASGLHKTYSHFSFALDGKVSPTFYFSICIIKVLTFNFYLFDFF